MNLKTVKTVQPGFEQVLNWFQTGFKLILNYFKTGFELILNCFNWFLNWFWTGLKLVKGQEGQGGKGGQGGQGGMGVLGFEDQNVPTRTRTLSFTRPCRRRLVKKSDLKQLSRKNIKKHMFFHKSWNS